ncbi:MAG: WD40 repeat domain-containing protein, partial [Vitreimonas sp.]
MLRRVPYSLIALSLLCLGAAVEGAAARPGSCEISEEAAAAGWRLERLAVISGERFSAFAGFATIAAHGRDFSDELWDVWTGERIRQLTPPATYATQNSIRESSRDGERGVIDWHMAPASLVDMRTGETLAQMPIFAGVDHVECCAYFTDDSRWLVLSARDGRYEIHNARTGALQGAFQLPPGQQDHDLGISPDGQRMLVVDAYELRLIDTATGAVITATPRRHSRFIADHNARFSPDGTRAVIQNSWEWLYLDARTGAHLATGRLPGGEGEFYLDFPEFLDGGGYAQFADNTGGRTIIEARTGRTHIALGPLAGEPTRAVQFGIQPSPDGRRFIARTPEGEATLWDVRTGRRLARLGRYRVESAYEPEPDEEEAIVIGGETTTSREFIFTTNGERLVSFDADDRLSVWDADTGSRIRILTRSDYTH